MQNLQPLFSILVANYNNGKYLQECLDSVFLQTYTNWEIIIVDDCSTDDKSFELYEKYRKSKKIHVFLNSKNMGTGYTKHKCVDKANGEFCAFLDPDDKLVNNAISTCIEAHIHNPKAAIVHSTHFVCNEALDVLSVCDNMKQILPTQTYFTSQNLIVSHFASFKIQNYNKTEGINKTLKRAIDQDLYYKLDETGLIVYINIPLYFYRIHNEGISTYSNQLKAKYWHYIVKKETYRRRRVNNFEPNISKKELKMYYERILLAKIEEKQQKSQIFKMLCYTLKSIINLPFCRTRLKFAYLFRAVFRKN